MAKLIVECCANSIQSVINGEKGEANRIELCKSLEVGGLTPCYDNILLAKSLIQIPIYVLIRPREGDFIYSNTEFKQITSDIKFCKKAGCDGVVIGMLKKDGSINKEQCKQSVNIAKPMHVTFNRAFDEANDLVEDLEDVIACGCDTLLTAGQETNVNLGFDNLKKLVRISAGRINILAGSGVNHKNAESLYKIGIRNFHLSGSKKNKTDELETDTLLIKAIINKLKQIV